MSVLLPDWALVSAFRYALGRSSYIAGDTIDLLRLHEHQRVLREHDWHTLVAREIRNHAALDIGLWQRDDWLRLADELDPALTPDPTGGAA